MMYHSVLVQISLVADSAQTEYCYTFHFTQVRPSVKSYTSKMYIGMYAIWIIRGLNKLQIFWNQIILAIFQDRTRSDSSTLNKLDQITQVRPEANFS